MYMDGRFVVQGDAATTASNILAHETAFRLGAVGNLIATVCYLAATLLVYELLKRVSKTVSLLAALFSMLGCGVAATMFLLNVAPLVLLGGSSYLRVFTTEQLQALALTSLSLGRHANNVGMFLFGCHILLVGCLIFSSGFIPRSIGTLLAIGGVGYWTNSFASFLALPAAKVLFPGLGIVGSLSMALMSLLIIIFFSLARLGITYMLPMGLYEFRLGFWLLIKGIRAPNT